MKWLVLGAVLAAAIVGAGAASAQVSFARPYVEIGAGQVFDSDVDFDGVQHTLDSDPNVFIAGGFQNFVGNVDLRFDVFTTDRYYDVGIFPQLQTTSYMVSGLFTVPVMPDRVDLYGGAGVGMVDVDFNGAVG